MSHAPLRTLARSSPSTGVVYYRALVVWVGDMDDLCDAIDRLRIDLVIIESVLEHCDIPPDILLQLIDLKTKTEAQLRFHLGYPPPQAWTIQ